MVPDPANQQALGDVLRERKREERTSEEKTKGGLRVPKGLKTHQLPINHRSCRSYQHQHLPTMIQGQSVCLICLPSKSVYRSQFTTVLTPRKMTHQEQSLDHNED